MKKVLIIVAAVVAIAVVAGAVALIGFSSVSDESTDNIGNSNSEQSDSQEWDEDSLFSTLTSSDHSEDVEIIVTEEDTVEEDAPVLEADITQPISTANGDSEAAWDAIKLAQVDQERAKQVASDFLWNFNTYNAQTLASGAYKMSWAKYVRVTDETSSLLRTRMEDQWSANCSTYPEIWSACTNLIVNTVYIDNIMTDGAVTVSITCTLDENQGVPGDMEWWYVNTNEVTYAVILDQSLFVTDVRRQYAKTIAFGQ